MAVLSLASAKEYLNITGTASDSALSATIDTAQSIIEQRVGPLEPTTAVKRVKSQNGQYLLLDPPIISLTSVVTNYGYPLNLTNLYVNQEWGTVEATNFVEFSALYYMVTYQRGRTTCPASLVEAVRVLTKHLWSERRTLNNGRTSDGASNTIPGAGYLLPFKVEQLLSPYMLTGIA